MIGPARRIVGALAYLLSLTMFGSGAAQAASAALATAEAPEGFGQLASSRIVFVDVYYGGRKIGETFGVTRPGAFRFRSPGDVLSKLPDVINTPELAATLGSELDTNSKAVCSQSNAPECGAISPQVIGIVYDEDRFRVDVFVNPRFLRTSLAHPDGYLPIPTASLSLTSAFGLDASGTIGGSSLYDFQNRTIVGLRNARLRANSSVSSNLGLIVDDLVGEVDVKSLRYSGGMFWAPGNDFIGQRRIIGAGVATQFDTWADQAQLQGTPLIVFLSQPGRVEILVDGRLVSSRSYPAGNVGLDTSELSDGSYPVLLRIVQSNGALREERRFFVKNAQVPPSRHPIFFAYAGVLANTQRHQPISPSSTFYYQAGTAWRLSNGFAVDVAALGTQHKAIAQAGAWFMQGPVRARAAGLFSSAGDWGALLQASTAAHGPLNLNFDLRRIWSRDGKPLIPLPVYANSFDLAAPSGVHLASGSYTQATASVGLQLGHGYLSLVGSYRKDRRTAPEYSIGPSVKWPVVTRNQVQVIVEASAQKTRTSTAAFAGIRVQFNSGRLSMIGAVGSAVQNDQGSLDGTVSRAVGTVGVQYAAQSAASRLNVGAAVDRNITSSLVHATGTVEGRFGNARADVLHNLEGQGGTQYDIALQSGLVVGTGGAELGGHDLQQSALVVSVNGDARDAVFDVVVDDARKGRVRIGRRLVLFMAPYRTYNVRLVSVAAVPVDFDTAARQVTLYPGNVQSLRWRAHSYFTVFGQAVSPAGAPITDGLVQTAKGISQTDANGYFQLDVRRDDPITIGKEDGSSCEIKLGNVAVRNDFASIGKVVCE
jgi:hypothetical protein